MKRLNHKSSYIVFVMLGLVLLNACSLQKAPANWQSKSTNAFASYVNQFLSGHDLSAQSHLKRAIAHAKNSADLEPLARIYLGKCGLNIAVGLKDNCDEYVDVSETITNPPLQAYYHLLQKKLRAHDVKNLPNKYREFAKSALLATEDKRSEGVNQAIPKMDNITAKLIASALVRDDLTEANIKAMVSLASSKGYKKAVIFWLNIQFEHSNDSEIKAILKKKIEILSKL